MIRVLDLRRTYGPVVALDGISFEVGRGEVLGFLGPNGAGKTTTMKILTGYLAPTSGRAWLGDREVGSPGPDPRALVGYLPEHAPVYPELTVTEYLDYVGRVRGIPRSARGSAVDRAVERCGLGEMRRRPIGALSKGYRQRTGLAQAILHDPEVLVLDEPTTGLDPNQVVEIRSLIRELGARRTVLFSSHVMREVQAVATRVVILNRGRIVADAPPERLLDAGSTFLIRARGCTREELAELGEMVDASEEDGEVTARLRGDSTARAEVARAVVERGWSLLELRPAAEDLESVFRALTSDEAA